uniref:Uncharacterized protein n=1 Tax=Arion vulgaris TaxID=1028688 RepID=A0A0B7BA93_9EUPU
MYIYDVSNIDGSLEMSKQLVDMSNVAVSCMFSFYFFSVCLVSASELANYFIRLLQAIFYG